MSCALQAISYELFSVSFFAFELTAVIKIRSKSIIARTRLREIGPETHFENIDDSPDEAEIKQLLPLPPLLEGVLETGAALALQASIAPSTTSTHTSSEKLLSTPSVL
jgi:hypothetical protein